MEAGTLVPHRLKVRLGSNEFDGEGDKETVKEQYEMWLKAVTAIPQQHAPQANSARNSQTVTTNDSSKITSTNSEVVEALWNRAYKRDGEKLSLNVLPGTQSQTADAILLLIYGYQKLMNKDSVTSVDLMEGAKQSGLRIVRIDKNIPVSYVAYINRGGTRKGTRYSLNNRGLAVAQNLLEGLFE